MSSQFSRGQIFLRILFPFAFGYFLSYLYRVVNAVLAPDLVGELGLSAATLGLLTASYFITFAAAQLPLGILLDRYGPRRIEAGLLLLAALGALIFATGESEIELIIGRGIIGLGVSACLMAAFKAFTLWFEPRRLPTVNGIIMAAGGIGALTATVPVQFALTHTDWRGVFLLLAGVTVLASLLVFLLVPEQGAVTDKEPLGNPSDGFRTIFSDPFFQRIAPVTMLSQASFISIQSLWAGPWLRDMAMLSRSAGADTLFLSAASMVCGFLVIGTLGERLSRLGIRLETTAGIGMLLFMGVQTLIIIMPPDGYITITWMAFGFFGTTGIIQYAVLSQRYPKKLAGRVNTAMNLLVFISAFSLQYLIGAIIELSPQQIANHYPAESYRSAFSVILALQVVAYLWFIRTRVPMKKS